MNIPLNILEAVDKGQCTLFLGAGASKPTGAPSGQELRDLITDEFLGGRGWGTLGAGTSLAQDWGLSLESAVSLACAQPGSVRVRIDKFVQNSLSGFSPSPSHLRIPWFRWRAIVTTNYDRLIEDAYRSEPRTIQNLIPVLDEKDIPSVETVENVPLFKPHGCITHPRDMSISLEGIYLAKQNRRLLFTYIEMLHLLGPVIYIGYSFKDVHILDMIYELTSRLGPYRRPILFVTLQENTDRAEKERRWFEAPPLEGIYWSDGFEKFMEELSNKITPAIVPSMIIKQMAPCQTVTFSSGGSASDFAEKGEKGEWRYWLTYKINHKDGYAGVIFERKDDTVDISRYGKVTFQLNVPGEPREDERLEVKLESTLKQHEHLLNIEKLRGKEWQEVSINLNKQDVPKTRLRRIVLADSGERATIGREYKIGVRNIKFE
jgi:hypothetical protein